jgi:TPR repeat protein
MKANQMAWLFLFFMLGVADAQQSNALPDVTPSAMIAELQSKAAKGDAKSQTKLGTCYVKGDGVTNDFSEAVKWYRMAAEQNYAKAEFNLGVCYDEGNGVSKDKTEAVKWYRKAAEQNEVHAQFNLGDCYNNGEGVAADKVQAVKWYRKAAEQGDSKAQFNLGLCYEDGEGVPKDLAEAVKWYREAAEQGDADAKAALVANQKGFKYFLTNTLTIIAFVPALIILTAVAVSVLRKYFAIKPDLDRGNR